nr:MAG TPA: hypothetical protein [Bacteriophage sp.]
MKRFGKWGNRQILGDFVVYFLRGRVYILYGFT